MACARSFFAYNRGDLLIFFMEVVSPTSGICLTEQKRQFLNDPALRSYLYSCAQNLCSQAGFCHADVEDLVQSCYLKATRYLPHFQIRDEVSTRAWFYKILYTVFCDEIRKRKKEGRDWSADLEHFPSDDTMTPESIRAVLEDLPGPMKHALGVLRPEYFVAFWLVVVEGLAQDELAEKMGMTRVNVAKLVFRSKEVLRRVLAPEK